MSNATATVESSPVVPSGGPFGKCSAEFYHAILFQAQARLPTLTRGHIYTADGILGKDFWDLLSDGEKRLAGKCLSHMATSGRLPLLPVTRPGARNPYPLLYQLI